MLLDVVYNHIGPGSEAIGAFGPYFTDAHHTFWGSAIDYSQRGVREWAIGNAIMWTRESGSTGCGSTPCTRSTTTTRRCTCCASCATASTGS